DLIGLESAQRSEGQRYLSLERKSGVAAGKDQSKAIVGNFDRVVIRLLYGRAQAGCDVRFNFFRESGAPADAVNGFMPSGLDEPSARDARASFDLPLGDGGGEGLLGGLFGEIEVADLPNQ